MLLYSLKLFSREVVPGCRENYHGDSMKLSFKKLLISFCLIAIGISLAVAGIYIGELDDAPGAAFIGIMLMIVTVIFGVKIARVKK